MRRCLLVVVFVIACGKSKSDDAKTSSGPERITNHALATTPLQPFTGKAGSVAFSIQVPLAELKAPETDRAYVTWEAKRGWFDTPSFTVQFNELPFSPDSTGDTQPFGDDAKDRTIARAEKLPDGGYLNLDQRTDHAFFRLEVCRPAASGSLCCAVSQRSDKPLESFDEIVAFAEKVCRSMKPT